MRARLAVVGDVLGNVLVRASSHRGIPMCAATSRAICSCDWGSRADTPIAATHRGDAVTRRSSSSSSSSSSSPAPNARWTTCATSEESTPPEKATTCIRAPAPAARVDSTIASSSRASRASSSPSPAASSAIGRASTFVVVGRGASAFASGEPPMAAAERRCVRAGRSPGRERPRRADAIERVIVHSPRVLSSASTASGCPLFFNPTLGETVPTPRTNVRELSRRRRPCRRRARNPPPSAPRSSRSAG